MARRGTDQHPIVEVLDGQAQRDGEEPRELTGRRRRLVEGVRDEQAARREPLRQPTERRTREPLGLAHRTPAPDEDILDDQIEALARTREIAARVGLDHLDADLTQPEPAPRRAQHPAVALDPDDARSRRERTQDARHTAATEPEHQERAASRGRQQQHGRREGVPDAARHLAAGGPPRGKRPVDAQRTTPPPHAQLDANGPRSLARAVRINSRHERSPVRAAGA